MKKLLLSATALSMAAFSANAGTLIDPVVEEVAEPEMAEKGSSSGGILLPLLLIAVAVAVISRDDSSSVSDEASDARVKRNIVHIGYAENGLPLYTFNYIWSKKTYEGVMAQDVLKYNADAVIVGLFGLMRVRYDMLGLKMRELA